MRKPVYSSFEWTILRFCQIIMCRCWSVSVRSALMRHGYYITIRFVNYDCLCLQNGTIVNTLRNVRSPAPVYKCRCSVNCRSHLSQKKIAFLGAHNVLNVNNGFKKKKLRPFSFIDCMHTDCRYPYVILES